MEHAHFDVTMEVYNHLGARRIEKIKKILALTSCRVAGGFVLWRQSP